MSFLAFPRVRSVAVALLVAAGGLPAAAQSGLDKAVVVAGLTHVHGADTFAWISLQPTDPALLVGKQIAVYRKSGGTASVNPYSRVAVIQPEADVRLVESLINRAAGLGENIAELNQLLTEMLEQATPAGGISAAQKLSALVSSSWGHEDKMRRLAMLARQRPSIALCAGLGHAERIAPAGLVTFELREFDTAGNADLGVIGRVTVDPGTPLVLPAPGPPVELPDRTAKGNLNASLRWGTPVALRDLSPLHYGYDLYRVTKARALANAWDSAPPATTAALVADAGTRKVNQLAILPESMLDAAQAANLANDTVFVVDDNRRYRAGGSPFADGAEFFYFVVARDLLGNGGRPSAGTLVGIRDRLPLNAPRKVEVRNQTDFVAGARQQRFMITWQAPRLEPGESVSAYYVYRWRTPSEIAKKSQKLDPVEHRPERNLIAILPGTQHYLLDDGSVTPPAWADIDLIDGVRLHPAVPDDHGKTFFYTIRAADNSVSGNLSGNSAPVWGVLRDREGPQGVNGELLLRCFKPEVTWHSFGLANQPGTSVDAAHLRLICATTRPRELIWAEFKIHPAAKPPLLLGRAAFAPSTTGRDAVVNATVAMADYSPQDLWCRVGTESGRISDWVRAGDPGNNTNPAANKIILAKWNASVSWLVKPAADCGWRNQGVDPVTGTANDVTGAFVPSTDSAEWRIYRRVDGGSQTLIAQGEISPPGSTTPVTWSDDSPPAGNCTICYYLQLLDSNSNPSTMEQQGECITQSDASWMPTPMLEPLTSVPPSLTPHLKLSWFCNPAGVERFEIWVGRRSGESPSSTGSALSTDQEGTHPNYVSGDEAATGVDFSVFQTARAAHLNPSGSPEFSVNLPVASNDEYIVMVRAVGEGSYGSRTVGSFSNVETASYTTRNFVINPQVPWPERALPPQADFHAGVQAAHLTTGKLSPWKGNAVRIGEYGDPATNAAETVGTGDQQGSPTTVLHFFRVSTLEDPMNRLYTNTEVATAEPLESPPGCILPVAMYRVQVANANFPTVPGDVVQVTPLMERLAYVQNVIAGETEVTDPWIAILHQADSPLSRTDTTYDHDIFLLDRQPVLKGARYKYLVARFSPTKEIERVIVTNTVDVP